MRLCRPTLLLLCFLIPLAAADFVRLDFKPFFLETDVGLSQRDKQKSARGIAAQLTGNLAHFQKLFGLKAKDFEEYAKFYGSEQGHFEELIRIRIWSDFDEFLKDFQARYETKARAAGFQGTIAPKDSEGTVSGPAFREISLHMDGISEKEALRTLYHEVGHLFMKTYIKLPCEVPSWLEEGTAQLWQFRPDNGTKPQAEVRERLAWLYEMTHGQGDDFVAFPSVRELIEVRNAHNLDFTHQNPLRSMAQYTMVWGLAHFLTDDPRAYKAFKKMLEQFKASAEERCTQLLKSGKRGKALVDGLREHLYTVQDGIIADCFGASFEEIEDAWLRWIDKSYTKTAKKYPEMVFYRALFHSRLRARFAPDQTWRDQAIARAQELLTELEQEGDDDGLVATGRALIAAQGGDWQTATDLFKQARASGSERLEVLIYGAGALIHEGKAAEVVEDLDQALDEAPGNTVAQGYLGHALLIKGEDYKRAVGLLRKAYENQKEQPELGVLAGLAQMLNGQDEEAFFTLAEAFQAQKQQDWVSATCIVLLAQRGNIEKDVGEWLARVMSINAEIGAKVKAVVDSEQLLQPAFGPDGRLGFLHVDLDPATATVPPDKPKRGRLFGR